MKLLFLGSGSAFTLGDNYQASMLLKHDNGQNFLIDCGSDSRWSLNEQKLTYKDIHNIYVSHLHSDHVGGLEWLALVTKFDPACDKPNLYISDTMVGDLWNHVLSGGLRSIENVEANLETFFTIHPIKDNGSFIWQGIEMKLVKTIHYKSGSTVMPTYGLFFTVNGCKIYISADSQFTPDLLAEYYNEADIIFHDCETSPTPTHVHANYKDLITLPEKIKKKMWLYHYNPGPLPKAIEDGFKGFVKKGQSFNF